MLSTIRGVIELMVLRAQLKIVRLIVTLDSPVSVHCHLPLGNGFALTPADRIEPVTDDELSPWREA